MYEVDREEAMRWELNSTDEASLVVQTPKGGAVDRAWMRLDVVVTTVLARLNSAELQRVLWEPLRRRRLIRAETQDGDEDKKKWPTHFSSRLNKW